MNSRQGFKCSTASKEAMLRNISSDVSKEDKGKKRFPRRWNQGPWGSSDKEVLPVNRIKANLRNCSICLAELWDWKGPLRTTLWFPFSLFLKGVVYCSDPAPVPSLYRECAYQEQITCLFSSYAAATTLVISSLGERTVLAQRCRILHLMQ